MENSNVVMAMTLTVLAGVSTSIGGIIGILSPPKNKQFLGGALSLSAGVMIYVSMIEIMPHAIHLMEPDQTEQMGKIIVGVSFILGMISMVIIDKLTHKYTQYGHITNGKTSDNSKLIRMGKITAIAIAVHNFPEGLATFTSVLADPAMGMSIAFAIAIHNIPEGIAVSAPIYYATGNKKQAFKWAFVSGISEPAAAIVGYLFLRPFLNEMVLGIVLALVAGIMVFISVDELLPTARKYSSSNIVSIFFILGISIMAVSLMFGGHAH